VPSTPATAVLSLYLSAQLLFSSSGALCVCFEPALSSCSRRIARERQSWRLDPANGSSRHDRPSPQRPTSSTAHAGTKKARHPSSRTRQRKVVTSDYAVVNSTLGMIPCLLDCCAERQTTFSRAPREYSLYPACTLPRKSSFVAGWSRGDSNP
jgi:hypothetical protein